MVKEVDVAVRLTLREAEVLRLIARRCTYAQAADRLSMSANKGLAEFYRTAR